MSDVRRQWIVGVRPAGSYEKAVRSSVAERSIEARHIARVGFTLLEAVVALAIVGVVAIATLGTLRTELSTADRANRALVLNALAADRIAQLKVLTLEELEFLPDSIRGGTFQPPFAGHRWEATSRPVLDEGGLFDVSVTVAGSDAEFTVSSRLYRRGGR